MNSVYWGLLSRPVADTSTNHCTCSTSLESQTPRSCVLIPGVRFPGLIHPGLIGTAPSQELLDIWNEREKKLVDDGDKAITLGGVLHTRPLGTRPLMGHEYTHLCRSLEHLMLFAGTLPLNRHLQLLVL